MSGAYLESLLLSACPGLRGDWDARRRSHAPHDPPDDDALLDAVRRHVLGLLAIGRVVEFGRFARSLERVLDDADPMLDDLLRERLLTPLARDAADAGVPRAWIDPHLGPRVTSAWRADR